MPTEISARLNINSIHSSICRLIQHGYLRAARGTRRLHPIREVEARNASFSGPGAGITGLETGGKEVFSNVGLAEFAQKFGADLRLDVYDRRARDGSLAGEVAVRVAACCPSLYAFRAAQPISRNSMTTVTARPRVLKTGPLRGFLLWFKIPPFPKRFAGSGFPPD